MQETKQLSRGLVSLPGYKIYETTRSEKGGGGLLTAIDENIDSVQVTVNEDVSAELLTVQLNIEQIKIRVINAYGPQEDDCVALVDQF